MGTYRDKYGDIWAYSCNAMGLPFCIDYSRQSLMIVNP